MYIARDGGKWGYRLREGEMKTEPNGYRPWLSYTGENGRYLSDEVGWGEFGSKENLAHNLGEGSVGNVMNRLSEQKNPFTRADWNIDPSDYLKEGILFAVPVGEVFNGVRYLYRLTSLQRSRIFWAGGTNVAGKAAEQYALKTGGITLGSTQAGQNLTGLAGKYPWAGAGNAKYMWSRLSATYAKGVRTNSVTVFLTQESRYARNIWNTVEKPILQQNGIKIIEKIQGIHW